LPKGYPPVAWAVLAIFAFFSGVWMWYKFRLGGSS